MQKYEINFTIDKKLTHQGRLDISKKLIQSILGLGGIVTHMNYLGMLFSFSKKNVTEKTKYIVVYTYINPIKITHILKTLKQNENVLKYMIIKAS